MKHTIKEISAKVESYCIDTDQMYTRYARPFKDWRKQDYRDVASGFKNLLGYFQDIRTNFPDATVELVSDYIMVDYGKGSAKIKVDIMMHDILLPEIEQYFILHKSKLAA